MKSTYKCLITVKTPLHIGCDQVYEPTGFVLDEKQNCLIHFDPIEFIAGLPEAERETLSSICRQGDLPSILRIYKFFQGKSALGRRISVTPEFVSHYRSTLNISENRIQQELNKFVIERTAFRAFDNRPFIPGSSVKGALRTGYLNHVCKGRRESARGAKELEGKLLNFRQIDEDPFGRVKVSDFQPVGETSTRVVYAINKKKKPSDKEARGPYQILEIIEPGAVFTGEITILKAHPKAGINHPVELQKLISGTHAFYAREHQRENRELISARLSAISLEESNKTLIRFGRHSGAESVTIEGNRSIRIMKGPKTRPVFLDHATTLWLASPVRKPNNNATLSPFGWSDMESITPVREKQLNETEKAYVKNREKELIEKQAATEQKMKEAENALKRKAEEQAREQARLDQEKAEQEQKQKELDAMSPEDRELAKVFDSGDILEDHVVDLYNRLGDMEEAFKIKCAERIKNYYKSQGKWKVSKKKKKQFEKVETLKFILGES